MAIIVGKSADGLRELRAVTVTSPTGVVEALYRGWVYFKTPDGPLVKSPESGTIEFKAKSQGLAWVDNG